MSAIATSMADLLGLDPSAVGPANLDRAAGERMRALGLDSQQDYLRALRLDPEERRLACGLAVVGETWFFRDPGVFDHLGRQAPALAKPVKVLCAPCSTGEEAYGAALALLRAGLRPDEFLIDAFDANAESLTRARAGRFGPTSFRNPPAALMRRFQGMENGLRQVPPEAVARVRFRPADLLSGGFGLGYGPYQFVFCRNFAMYLDAKARVRLGATLSALMAPGAVLYVGHAEVTVFSALGFPPLGLPGVFACAPPGQASSRPRRSNGAKSALAARAGLHASPVRGARADGAGRAPGHGSPRTTEPPFRALSRPGALSTDFDAKVPSRPPAAPDDARERAVRALADAGRLREALTLAQAALDQGPPTAELFHLLAVARLGLGQKDLAERALRRAIYLCPGHVEALTLLELLAAARGDETQAALLARRADRAAADSREAKP
ncbi:CheR family methyltransferase [Fundidesulfovibrio butyratiphilus]